MKKIVAVTAILMVVVACSPQPPAVEPKDTASVEELNPADYTRDQGASAELDRETGEITLPLEQYFMDKNELSVANSAAVLSMARCMQKAGYPAFWVPTNSEDRDRSETQRYGRWVMRYAEQYGYADVPDPLGQQVREYEVAWATQYSEDINNEEYDTAEDRCGSNGEDLEIIAYTPESQAPPEVLEMRDLSYLLMKNTPEAQEAENQWRQCVEAEGFVVEEIDNEFAIANVSYIDADEESIRAAIADVHCKDETNLIKRLSDIEASFQAPVAAKYEAELVAMRASVEESLAAIDDYMKAHAADIATLTQHSQKPALTGP